MYLIEASTILYVEAYFSLTDLYVPYVLYLDFFQLVIALYALCVLQSSFYLATSN